MCLVDWLECPSGRGRLESSTSFHVKVGLMATARIAIYTRGFLVKELAVGSSKEFSFS